MKRTWIVVMDRTGARLFERVARMKKLSVIKEWEHPGGNFRESELTSDRPGIGRMNSREYRGNVYTPPSTAKEHTLEDFCQEVSRYLNHKRMEDCYDELVLVAEPHTLGKLKESLNEQVSRKIIFTLDKDLAWMKTRDIPGAVLHYL